MKKNWISAFGFIILVLTTGAWAAPVPDTGQTKCYNNTVEIPCPSAGQPFYGQDADYSINPMSYTKLDGNGSALPDGAGFWVMVRDNVTGLIWENKTDDGTVHDKDNTYTWYDPADPNPGTPGDGTNTKAFIDALNSMHFGGYNDWRLPAINELESVVNFDIPGPGPTINTNYFPNTVSSFYWSATSYAGNTAIAWGVPFGYGYGNGSDKSYSHYVRAVRGGPSGILGNLATGSFYMNNGDGTVDRKSVV
jgi:hypothetical protein